MRIKVPIIVKDPLVTRFKGVSHFEEIEFENEEFFLDGPVSARVAVLDFDPETGRLGAGAKFRASTGTDDYGGYEVDPHDLDSPEFMQVSVFGTVLKALSLFEEEDNLGRRIAWAFDGNQLLVVPRAGRWANAYYERESHSLQFFVADNGVHACKSQDIVAHETAHAILDAVAPDLYDSYSPQALALHEAIADITTLLMAFRSRVLAARILDDTGGSIKHSSAFTAVASAFATALGRGGLLRDLKNDKSLIAENPENAVSPYEPHDLSQVLSGALYTTMFRLHETLKEHYATSRAAEIELVEEVEVKGIPGADQQASVASKALFVASERFKRVILRALDYLPPGDVSFADYARAIVASDQASHPESPTTRKWLADELIGRGIGSENTLKVKTNFDHPAVQLLDLNAFLESDWIAYQFAEANRDLLRIPAHISPFEVRPRLKVRKLYYHRDGRHRVTECIMKIAWTEVEDNNIGNGFPVRRRLRKGTMLAIDWQTKRVRAVLTTEPENAPHRDAFLLGLFRSGRLRLDDHSGTPNVAQPNNAVYGNIVDNALRVHGAARTLHIASEV